MSISTIVTHGFGNGTLAGSVADVVTFGYAIGAETIQNTTIRLTPNPTKRSLSLVTQQRTMTPNPTKRTTVINRA